MAWTQVLSPEQPKVFMNIVRTPIQITGATLVNSNGNEPVKVKIYTLLHMHETVAFTLQKDTNQSEPLNITLRKGHPNIWFSMEGKGTVQLSGNYICSTDSEDYDFEYREVQHPRLRKRKCAKK